MQEKAMHAMREFATLVEAAIANGQEVHCTVHLGTYPVAAEDGWPRWRKDGTAVLMVFVEPLAPERRADDVGSR
jgi:hypothetical protein